MRQIIPFKKELSFKTKVSDITSISLERELEILDEGIITGIFHITGDYKMNEGSINREEFSFDLPFDITLDPRYDIKSVKSDIEDFYYDVIDESILKVNIDLFVEALYLPESNDEIETVINNEVSNEIDEDIIDDRLFDKKVEENEDVIEVPNEIKIEKIDNIINEECDREDTLNIGNDLFSNLDNTETYVTYYVYIVKEEDSIDTILTKYGITKEEFEDYNDINSIKPGDKVIIPKKSE